MSGYIWASVHIQVRGKLVAVCSLLPPDEFWGCTQVFEACWQVPLSTELSYWLSRMDSGRSPCVMVNTPHVFINGNILKLWRLLVHRAHTRVWNYVHTPHTETSTHSFRLFPFFFKLALSLQRHVPEYNPGIRKPINLGSQEENVVSSYHYLKWKCYQLYRQR